MCKLNCKECPKPCGSKNLGENNNSLSGKIPEISAAMVSTRRINIESTRIRMDVLRNLFKSRGPINTCVTNIPTAPGTSDYLKSFQLDSLNTIFDLETREKLASV